MPTLDSTQKLVAVKAYARGNAIPLDASSTYDTISEAAEYASTSPVAYQSQLITTVDETGMPKAYLLKKESVGYSLVHLGLTIEEVEQIAKQIAQLEWGTIED